MNGGEGIDNKGMENTSMWEEANFFELSSCTSSDAQAVVNFPAATENF